MREPQTPQRSDEPLPRDREDQQATDDEDPLSIPEPAPRDEDDQLADTDVSGTGPRGRTRSGTVHPEHPTPDEPAD
ncbi:hypothetical protein EAO71_34980 [Streptomyces sp. ms191]|uniref:hypothetical protein n=1 Tax=Streptomyces sp. ms191 TaxID=1827978 RepID=UPI0011CD9819|nr:hypothetical protein [Streptomyces sp. ms191]TXS16191.1 hypothetical protein EAO71_34980 [Streptomyces sp. ms191]